MKAIPEPYLMKAILETYLMKAIPETYLMKAIPETYLMKAIPETYLMEGHSRNVPDEGHSRNVPNEGHSRNVPDEGHSRNELCELNLISTFLLQEYYVLTIFHGSTIYNTVIPLLQGTPSVKKWPFMKGDSLDGLYKRGTTVVNKCYVIFQLQGYDIGLGIIFPWRLEMYICCNYNLYFVSCYSSLFNFECKFTYT
jgi:hypothetical protein